MGGAAGAPESAWLEALRAPSHNSVMHGSYRVGAPLEPWGPPLESLLPGSRGGGSLHSSGRDTPGAAMQQALYGGAAVGASAGLAIRAQQLGMAGGEPMVRPGFPAVGTLMGPTLGSLQLGSGSGGHGSSEPLHGLGPGLGMGLLPDGAGLAQAPEVALPRLHIGESSHAGDGMLHRSSGVPSEQHPEARCGESCRLSPLVRGYTSETQTWQVDMPEHNPP